MISGTKGGRGHPLQGENMQIWLVGEGKDRAAEKVGLDCRYVLSSGVFESKFLCRLDLDVNGNHLSARRETFKKYNRKSDIQCKELLRLLNAG